MEIIRKCPQFYEKEIWSKAVSLVEDSETNIVNHYRKIDPKNFRKAVCVTDIIEYFKTYKEEVKKNTKPINDLSVAESIEFTDAAINDLAGIVEYKARRGNGFHENYLYINFPKRYSRMKKEQEEFRKRMAQIPDEDLPF